MTHYISLNVPPNNATCGGSHGSFSANHFGALDTRGASSPICDQNDRPVEKYYALPEIVCTLTEYVGG